MTRAPILSLSLWVWLSAAAPPIAFVPESPGFAAAADEYRAIWETQGRRIVAALEAATGLRFPAASIEAIVNDGPPMAAYGGRSMRLRALYSPDYKKATLVHELGHLLSFALPRTADLDDHRLLSLPYDVWTDLYGRDFATAWSRSRPIRTLRLRRRLDWAWRYSGGEAGAAAGAQDFADLTPQVARSSASPGAPLSASVSGGQRASRPLDRRDAGDAQVITRRNSAVRPRASILRCSAVAIAVKSE